MADTREIATTINNAGREVFSFSSAVREMHGEEQSKLALDDWLDIFNAMPNRPESSTRYWRSITLLAASRLAARLCEKPCCEVPIRRNFDLDARSRSQDQSPDEEIVVRAHQV